MSSRLYIGDDKHTTETVFTDEEVTRKGYVDLVYTELGKRGLPTSGWRMSSPGYVVTQILPDGQKIDLDFEAAPNARAAIAEQLTYREDGAQK